MAGSLNKAILIGNLGADPELRNVSDTAEVCSLRLATSRSWKDQKTGEQKEVTEWHSVSVWDPNSINYAKNYLKKGAKIYVEGKLETRKWQDQSGADRYSTEVVVRPISGKLVGLSTDAAGTGPNDNSGSPSPLDSDWIAKGDIPF